MTINIDIKSEDINKYISEEIIKSSLGKEFKQILDREIRDFGWQKAVKKVVNEEICHLLRQYLKTQQVQDQLREKIATQLNYKTLWDLSNKAIERLLLEGD